MGIALADGQLIEQGTKTHQSRRVTLDAGTVEVLADHRDWSEENAKMAGAAITKQSFVFSHAVDGSTPWRPDSTTRAFRILCDEAGITGVRRGGGGGGGGG